MPPLVCPLDIRLAARRLNGRVRRTPLVRLHSLTPESGDRSDRAIWLKLECLQITGAFKLRGAFNALLALVERHSREAIPPPAIVTASAGNHGLGIAHAARGLGLTATIFTSRDAPETKLRGIRAYGADLRATCASYEDAELAAKAFASDRGAVYISAYSHPDVIAGAGTIALEVIEDLPAVETVIVPVGGGGLVAGIAIAAKSIDPLIRVVGVEAEASHPFRASLAAGRITRIDVQPTLADGLAGNLDPDSITFELVRDHVDEMVTVSETELGQTIRMLAAEEHLIVEAAGAAAVAAVRAGKVEIRPGRTAAIVTGANIDLQRLSGLIA
jgi:threonine dehydratase